MVRFEDLEEITNKEEIKEHLERMISNRDDKGNSSPIITGYNWYNQAPKVNRVITFSHIQGSEVYKENMILDLKKLGYSREQIDQFLREKGGFFIWKLKFEICDEGGNIYPGLKIWDIDQNQWLNLNDYNKPLIEYDKFKHREGKFLALDLGWQLDIPFYSKEELFNLTNLFIQKGNKKLFESWPGAYETPVLLLGSEAINYQRELPDFIQATKMGIYSNSNEISFIVHKRFDLLKNTQNYLFLKHLGFTEELCLGNKLFIRDYIDEEK